MELDLGDWVAKHIFVSGVFELGVTSLLAARVRRGDTVVDVGANVGYFTLLCAGLVGDRGQVVAIEPNPEVRTQLERNIARNDLRNVRVFDFALADEPGELTLFLGPPDNTGLSSFRTPRDCPRALSVRTERFDTLLPPWNNQLALVKIDVEGAELKVLRGMRHTLAVAQPDLIVELSPDFLAQLGDNVFALLDLLEGHGYTGYELREYELVAFARTELQALGQFNAYFTTHPLPQKIMTYDALRRMLESRPPLSRTSQPSTI
jgi:FkbM family methyltransferase